MNDARLTIRLSAADVARVAAITAAMTDDKLRPSVSLSDAMRSALRIAAATLVVSATAGC